MALALWIRRGRSPAASLNAPATAPHRSAMVRFRPRMSTSTAFPATQDCRAAHLPSGHRDVGLADPINPEHRHHRVAKLLFQMRGPDGSSQDALKRQDVEYHEACNGTVQHELFAGKQFAEDESGLCFIQCSEDAGTLSDPIPFGLVVTVKPQTRASNLKKSARVSVPVAIPVSWQLRRAPSLASSYVP